MILLAVVALVGYFGLGLWRPWQRSDYPIRWLILTGAGAYAFLWFGLPLAR